ncbi:IclR family transcriptional regulator [Desulfatiglans anilini]|uniref:IclR family transcriptional regulator n=1 Tax=Desulfatiglans anilini TaxID=90728 RepID=UPI00041E4FC7|nr:IclR family transcriptional regulator [Desulfatiglans anilini]
MDGKRQGKREDKDMADRQKETETAYRVQVLERALDILDAFSFETREMSLSEIVQKTGLNKTTVKRLLANLTARRYLRQDPLSKRYHLGLRLFELGSIVFSSFSLRKSADRAMSRLRNETGATVLLGVLMDNQLVYADKKEGSGAIRVVSDIGWRRPPHYGMLGMVLMAHLKEDAVDRILEESPLESYTVHSIVDNDRFKRRLQQIREQGYVVEHEEALDGVIGIAAPIRGYPQRVVGALGVALTATEGKSEERLNTIVDKLRQAAEEISADLGGGMNP